MPKDHGNQIMLHHQCLEAQILEELAQTAPPPPKTATLTEGKDKASQMELKQMDPQIQIIDRICQANCKWNHKQHIENGDSAWTREGELLLYQNRLYVPDQDDLRVKLLDQIHQKISTAHPGKSKTQRLLKERGELESRHGALCGQLHDMQKADWNTKHLMKSLVCIATGNGKFL